MREITQPTLSLLIYHRVREVPDPLFPEEVDRASFTRHMTWLRRWFRVLPLTEAVRRLADGSLPRRAASVTFDDGYADNAEIALPILKKYEIPATFFIATGYLDGGLMWNDAVIHGIRKSSPALDLRDLGLDEYSLSSDALRRDAIDRVLGQLKYFVHEERTRIAAEILDLAGEGAPNDFMMTTEQVRELATAGMEIGAHTVSHPILSRCELQAARWEISKSREHLQDLLDRPVEMFAYPNGIPGRDYNVDHVEIVRELGFLGAVSTATGVATSEADPFQLPRFTPWDRSQLGFVGRLALNTILHGNRATGVEQVNDASRASP